MNKLLKYFGFGSIATSIIGALAMPVSIMFLFIVLISSFLATSTGGVDGEEGSYKLKPIIKEHYEKIQKEIKEEKEHTLNLKYMFGMDYVHHYNPDTDLNEFEFETSLVSKNDFTCFYKPSFIFEENKEDVFSCLNWNDEYVEIFQSGVEFYENYLSLNDLGMFIRPFKNGIITNEFGGFDATDGDGHKGIDLVSTTEDISIYPVASGKVIRSGYEKTYGNHVSILHEFQGKNYVSTYAHMKEIPLVKTNDEVQIDTKIGEIGNTGLSLGAHLHLEINEGKTFIRDKRENPRNTISFPELGIAWTDRGDNLEVEKEQLFIKAGIHKEDYNYADYIIQRESSWNHLATNKESGAFGLCQALPPEKMASAGEDWKTNPVTQLKWCNDYAKQRYGNWLSAYEFWIINRWW